MEKEREKKENMKHTFQERKKTNTDGKSRRKQGELEMVILVKETLA